MMFASLRSARALGVWLGFGLALSACHDYPKTPELAFTEVERTVAAADGLRAWKIIDPDTRREVESVFGDERQGQTIVKAKYPPAAAQQELARLAATDEPDAAHFFARTIETWSSLPNLRQRLGSLSGPIQTKPDGETIWMKRADGKPFHLVKVGGGWAWMDLRSEWSLEKIAPATRCKRCATTRSFTRRRPRHEGA